MRKIALTATAAFFALGAAAHAQQQPSFYANAGALYLDADGAGLGALIGRVGVDFYNNIGLEVEGGFGIDSGSTGGITYDLNHLLGAYAKLGTQLAPNVSLFGRVGYYTIDVDASFAGVTTSGSDDDVAAGLGLEFGLGGFNRHGIRVDYTNYGLDGDGHSGSLAYVLRF